MSKEYPVSDGRVSRGVKVREGYITRTNKRSMSRGDLRSGRDKQSAFEKGVGKMQKGNFTACDHSKQNP